MWNAYIGGDEIGLSWECSTGSQLHKDDVVAQAFYQSGERLLKAVSCLPLEQEHSTPGLQQLLLIAAQRDAEGTERLENIFQPVGYLQMQGQLPFENYLTHVSLISGRSGTGATKYSLRCSSCHCNVHTQLKSLFSACHSSYATYLQQSWAVSEPK